MLVFRPIGYTTSFLAESWAERKTLETEQCKFCEACIGTLTRCLTNSSDLVLCGHWEERLRAVYYRVLPYEMSWSDVNGQ